MKRISLIFFLISSITASSQLQLDSALVYNNYSPVSTTMGMNYFFHLADSLQMTTSRIPKREIDQFNTLFIQLKAKKHFQQKFGGELFYVLGYSSGLENRLLVVGKHRIVNLSTGREYRTKQGSIDSLEQVFSTLKNLSVTTRN